MAELECPPGGVTRGGVPTKSIAAPEEDLGRLPGLLSRV
jgi:hypothetical protein